MKLGKKFKKMVPTNGSYTIVALKTSLARILLEKIWDLGFVRNTKHFTKKTWLNQNGRFPSRES